MSGFRTIGEVIDAEIAGRARGYFWRKIPSVTTTIGIWFDLSMSPGNPPPKYWFDATPLKARAITQSADGGIFHGPNVSPQEKFLRKLTVMSNSSTTANPSPMNAILLDYILYYPTIDDGTLDEQLMDNTVTLPRYTNGEGVMMMAITTGARTGGQTFTVKYTNSQGVSGKVTPIVTQNTAAFIGAITTSNRAVDNGAGWMIPLADGDSGVRLIESVTMNGIDTGLFSLLLVKPLAQISFTETQISTAGTAAAPYEKDFLIPTADLPKIVDDAYLNYIVLPQTSLSTLGLNGDLKLIWN